MTDEPRDDERLDDDEPANGDGDASDAPPPRTWAGQARAGEGESGSGITEEFAGLEEELNAELDEFESDEDEADGGSAEEPDAADELEEPPAEFDFEEESEDGDADGGEPDPAAADEAAPEAEADEAAPEAEEANADEAASKTDAQKGPGQETVESDTLAIADREAAEEAAHAGLRARAQKTAAERVGVTGAQASVAKAVAAAPAAEAGEPPKRTIGWRFIAASFVVVASTAAATAIAFLLYLTDIGSDLRGDDRFAAAVEQNLDGVEGGDPQTILILGSDKRTTAPGDPGRSDTTMLLRVDPDKEFLALLSLPRDLMVEIPGYGTDRLNAAYSYGEQFEAKQGGGGDLTLRTVQDLLGIDINHIVNINFQGFYDAINAIGCVYIDVDRHYFNPVGGEYDAIDIKPGYTKLCGYTALDYVRYRHNDNDLVRGARQQAFVREARQQIPPRDLLPFFPSSNGDELIKIFTEYTTSDIDDAPTIIEMLKSFVEVRNAPVRQVSLGELTAEGGVGASKEDIETAVDQFLGNDLDQAPAEEPEGLPEDEKKKKQKEKEPEEPSGPAMVDATGESQEYASQFQNWLRGKKAKLPVLYPAAVIANQAAGISPESRAHTMEPPGFPTDPKDEPFYGYKYVLPYQESFGLSYYGVAGVNWTDAPILNNPSEVRRIDGRDYMLFYEKDRLRLVGWQTDDGSYWVNNTLTRVLSEGEMLEVATSVREFEG